MPPAAFPTSPSNIAAPFRTRCARRSATGSMAATTASPSAPGTSSPARPTQPGLIARKDLASPQLSELALLDDAAFRAHVLRRARSSASAATVSFEMCCMQSATVRTHASPRRHRALPPIRTRWWPMPRNGRSPALPRHAHPVDQAQLHPQPSSHLGGVGTGVLVRTASHCRCSQSYPSAAGGGGG